MEGVSSPSRPGHALSPFSPASHCTDQSDFDVDFSSSDDEAGVFFGAHQPVERKIVATLSRSIPPSPAQPDLAATATPPRRSSLINRVKKRDSREFLRRKTLLLGTPERIHERAWASPAKSASTLEPDALEPEAEAGPSTPTPVIAEDVSVDLGSLRLDTFPPSEDDNYLSHASFDDDDDKENSAAPEDWFDEDDYQEYVPEGAAPPPITVGYRDGQYEHELSAHLDMGNLSIFDIDDPECVPTEMGNDTGGSALLGTSLGLDQTLDLFDLFDRDSDDGELSMKDAPGGLTQGVPSIDVCEADDAESDVSFASANGASSHDQASDTGATIAHEDAPQTDDASFAVFSDHSDAFELGQRPQLLPRSLLDDTADFITFTPLKPNGQMEPVNEADVSYASDMDSPMARGPVMIPVFSVASPPRAREVTAKDDNDMLPHPADEEMLLALSPLRSPAQSPHALYRSLLERTPGSAKSPSTSSGLGSSSRSHVLQHSTAKRTEPPSAHAKKMEERTEARRTAAREQLDSIFSSRTLPPSHDLAASVRPMRSPATAPAPPAPVQVRPAHPRAPAQALRPTKILAKSPGKLPAKSPSKLPAKSPSKLPVATRTKPATLASSLKAPNKQNVLHAPRPVSATKGVKFLSGSAPTAASGASSQPAPLRSALKRPAGTAADRAPPSTKATRVLPPVIPAARPVAPLKRPFAATASSSARVAATTGAMARPALGLPSRLVRDPVSGTAFMTTSASGASGLGPLSRPVRSPAKQPSPTRPTLGRPSRPTGMTPVAHRTMQTPQHGFTPTRAQKLGTPSRPSATPLRHRQLAMAVVPESKSSPTPVRGEQPPPSPAKRLATPTHGRSTGAAPQQPQPALEPPQAQARLPSPDKMLSPNKQPSPVACPGAHSLLVRSPSRVEADEAAKDTTEPAEDQPAENSKDVEMSEPESAPESQPATESEPEQPRKDTATDTASERAASPAHETTGSRRSSRTTRTPARLTPSKTDTPKTRAPRAPPAPSIAPGMSESELKKATTRNTVRNQVYLCTIDRQIVRVDGPRPPSPTSSIRTTADREREDRKAGREARAKRRQRGSMGDSEPEDEGAAPVEQVPFERRARGDDDEYETPRPVKRAKLDDGGKVRFVHWDKSATVIHGGLGDIARPHPAPPSPNRLKGCFTPKGKYPLDKSGNAVDRPVEKLKRSTVTVRAMFYDGEEPAPFSYNAPPSSKRKGKK